MSQQVERQVGEHLQQLGEATGKRLQVSFTNPDYVVAAETIGVQCDVACSTAPLENVFRSCCRTEKF